MSGKADMWLFLQTYRKASKPSWEIVFISSRRSEFRSMNWFKGLMYSQPNDPSLHHHPRGVRLPVRPQRFLFLEYKTSMQKHQSKHRIHLRGEKLMVCNSQRYWAHYTVLTLGQPSQDSAA
mmetsp:Transcript_9070/g.14346  ORF Transcript_9070/g.14346 Transcript_9070/m.14346 type:complete len:121 (+) Transcript_9070:94-456(+)